MRVPVVTVLIALLAGSFAGCLGTDAPPAPPEDEDPLQAALAVWDAFLAKSPEGGVDDPPVVADPAAPAPHVTVAVIDTGVNPFHEFFQRPDLLAPGTSPVAAVDASTAKATSALYVPVQSVADREAGTWLDDLVQPRTLYRFAGTPLYYYSLLDDVEMLDEGGHGTATSASVLLQEPNATVVMVQTSGATLNEAIGWANAQPWIDVISVSWGCPANCAPLYPLRHAGFDDETLANHREAWNDGKLIVNSAGNDPTPHHFDSRDGPPWVIAAGGADPYRKGEAWIAAKQPDVLSDFTVVAPDHTDLTSFGDASGTSFAAPSTAGTLAAAILGARQAANETGGIANGTLVPSLGLDNADFRHALNRSAVYWTTTDYDATATHPSGATDLISAGIPINPAAPWLQMGWGYVDRDVVPTMLDMLLEEQTPAKDPLAVQYMAEIQGVREALWT